MAPGSFRFERFSLDAGNRQLRRDDVRVELNARYLDALALLVGEAGKLVSKERFLEDVWKGVPVTDEALTQCVKTLRRQLGDDAGNPRFIETVPKHGYRFIAPVHWVDGQHGRPAAAAGQPVPETPPLHPWLRLLLLGGAGTAGGGVAGILGGLLYGFGGVSEPLEPGMGAASVLIVLVCLSMLVGLIGGAGVAFGIAAASIPRGRSGHWGIAGGAAGGLIVGAFVKLLGLDAFNLLLGQSPGDITGAAEGTLLGGAVGLGAWIGNRAAGPLRFRRGVAAAALAGAAAGILITLAGGHLMGGSLALLASRFPDSRLRLGQIGALFGEDGFGPITRLVTGGLEGMLFAAGIVGAMLIARRSLDTNP